MQITAQAKYIKMSPRKVRLVAEAIKRLTPAVALDQLSLMPKRAAEPIASVLRSALANATKNAKLDADAMRIKSIVVGGGPALKRWRPVSRGRAHPYKKRMSHITVVLTNDQSQQSRQKPALTPEEKGLPEVAKVKSQKKGEKDGTKG